MKMTLIINEVEINLGIESMKDIVDSLADKREFQNAYHQMALSNIASIRADVANRDNISEETAKVLLIDKDNAVLENIINNEIAQSIATDEDIEHIMTYGSQYTVKIFVSTIESFENIDSMAIYTKLLEENNADIILSLAENYNTPKKILKKLAKNNDKDIAQAAKSSLE